MKRVWALTLGCALMLALFNVIWTRFATVERFMIASRLGNAITKMRFTRSAVSVRSAFVFDDLVTSRTTVEPFFQT